jgi:hypothetical protein
MTYPEIIEVEREKLRRFFSKKELRSKVARNPVTRLSLIQRYHRLHQIERYLTFPENVITPQQILAIITKSK